MDYYARGMSELIEEITQGYDNDISLPNLNNILNYLEGEANDYDAHYKYNDVKYSFRIEYNTLFISSH